MDLNPIPIAKNNYNNFYDKKKNITDQQEKNKIQGQKINNSEKNFPNSKKNYCPDEWEYLKKHQECKEEHINLDNSDNLISDDFIKFDDFKEKTVINDDLIINSHMRIIKENAKLLTQEGELISNIKGVGSENFQMEEYTKSLEQIINKKILLYAELKKNIEIYKNQLKQDMKFNKDNKV